MYQVTAIPAFSDNYIWALHGNNNKCAIVDPGHYENVMAFLQNNSLNLSEILITHHHSDHIGGVKQLLQAFPECKVFGPNTERFKHFARGKVEGDTCYVSAINSNLTVMSLVGHTIDHIAFYDQHNAFVGDTLFSMGCGRLFEGSPKDMFNSLAKIAQLPPQTNIYCAHEYTLSNIEFARFVEPNNADITTYQREMLIKRQNGQHTIPIRLETQLKLNPFLRAHTQPIMNAVAKLTQEPVADALTCFTKLRQLKDNF